MYDVQIVFKVIKVVIKQAEIRNCEAMSVSLSTKNNINWQYVIVISKDNSNMERKNRPGISADGWL